MPWFTGNTSVGRLGRPAPDPPPAWEGALGATLWDTDGNAYVDYAIADTVSMLGYQAQPMLGAWRQEVRSAWGATASPAQVAQLAQALGRTVPCAEVTRFYGTGREAVDAAFAVACAATGRRRAVSFVDQDGSWLTGAGPDGRNREPGPVGATTMINCLWDDLPALEQALSGGDVAAVFMKPLNLGGHHLLATHGYLQAAAATIRRAGAVLVFDETLTAFRIALGGAQQALAVIPDLAVLGRGPLGGLPITALCGRSDVMAAIADSGPRSAPLDLDAGDLVITGALITELETNAATVYPSLAATMAELSRILREEAQVAGYPLHLDHFSGLGSVADIRAGQNGSMNGARDYAALAAALFEQRVRIMPEGVLFVSTAHTAADLNFTRDAAGRAFRRLT